MNTENQNQVAVPTADELIEKELVKYNEIVPKVEELKEMYLPLKIASIEDEDGYKEVATALRVMVGKRTAIEEKRKELKAFSLRVGKAIDDKAKEITEMIAPIEQHLKAEKERIDNEKKRIEQERLDAIKAIVDARSKELMAFGCKFIPTENMYVWVEREGIPEEQLHAINLEIMNDEDYNSFVEVLKGKNEQLVAIMEQREQEAAELKRKQQEEAERLRLEQEQLQRQKEEMEAEKERMAKELMELKREKAKYRVMALEALDIQWNSILQVYGKHGEGNIFHPLATEAVVLDSTNEEWDEKLAQCKKWVADYEEKIKAEAEQKRLEDERLAEEKKRKDEIERKRIEEETEVRLKREKEQEERRKALAEQERLDNMSDKEKMLDYIVKIEAIGVPSIKTVKYKSILNTLRIEIKKAKESIGK